MNKSCFTFILAMLFSFSCNSPAEKVTFDKLAHDFNNEPIVVETLLKLRTNQSIMEVSNYIKAEYNVQHFDKYYSFLVPYTKATAVQAARQSGSDSTMLDLNTMMHNAGITKDSQSYKYVKSVSDIFDGKTHSDPETILPKLTDLKENVSNSSNITDQDKSALISLTNMLSSNYEELVHMIEANHGHKNDAGRVQCFFCSAWRVIRSVVVTVVATALVAAAILNPVFGVGVVLALKIGAVIGGVWSTVAAVNDVCYYSIGCLTGDPESAGNQYCSSGDCILE